MGQLRAMVRILEILGNHLGKSDIPAYQSLGLSVDGFSRITTDYHDEIRSAASLPRSKA